jgi:hypothetical protein
VKILICITAATLLAFSALRAQDVDDAAALKAASNTLSADPFADLAASSDSGSVPAVPMDAATAPANLSPPTTPDESESLDQTLYGEEQAIDDTPPQPTAQSRPWKVNLHASAESYYDDNIFISPTGRKSDFITLLSVGGGLILGDYTARQDDYLISDYTAIGEIFERHSDQDAFEQSGSVEGQLVMAQLILHGDFELQDTSDEDVDVGTRAERQIYTGNGSARYNISDKTFIEATAQFTVAHYELYIGSTDERGGISFNYLPDPDLTLGLGVMAGVLSVADSDSQTYQQLLASAQFAATGKCTLQASLGVEDRQTSDNNGLVTPVFQISGDYKPFDGLDFSIAAYRKVVNSAFYAGSDYIATGLSASALYELSDRFSLLFAAGYMNCDYRQVAVGANVSRDDNFAYVRPAFRYTASRYLNVELYYFYRNNASTVHTSSFNDTQAGLSVNVNF